MKTEATVQTVTTVKKVMRLELHPEDLIVMLREHFPLLMKDVPYGATVKFETRGDSYCSVDIDIDNPLKVTITHEETQTT